MYLLYHGLCYNPLQNLREVWSTYVQYYRTYQLIVHVLIVYLTKGTATAFHVLILAGPPSRLTRRAPPRTSRESS